MIFLKIYFFRFGSCRPFGDKGHRENGHSGKWAFGKTTGNVRRCKSENDPENFAAASGREYNIGMLDAVMMCEEKAANTMRVSNNDDNDDEKMPDRPILGPIDRYYVCTVTYTGRMSKKSKKTRDGTMRTSGRRSRFIRLSRRLLAFTDGKRVQA